MTQQRTSHPISSALLALLLTFTLAPASADDIAYQDAARKAFEAGHILPLRTILDQTNQTHPGQVLEAELEREDGIWIYEIKILRADGVVLKLSINAKDASLIKARQR